MDVFDKLIQLFCNISEIKDSIQQFKNADRKRRLIAVFIATFVILIFLGVVIIVEK